MDKFELEQYLQMLFELGIELGKDFDKDLPETEFRERSHKIYLKAMSVTSKVVTEFEIMRTGSDRPPAP